MTAKPRTPPAIPVLPFVPPDKGKGGLQMAPPEGEYNPFAPDAADISAPAGDPDAVSDDPSTIAGKILQQKLGASLGSLLALGLDLNPPNIPLVPGTEIAANTLGKTPFRQVGDAFGAGALHRLAEERADSS